MFNERCRLCSSETALISLFNGKSMKNRDSIRKLVDVTTGIQFQENDTCKCICFACTLQIYNFYIFRTRSIENEKKIQEHVIDSEKQKSNKIEIPDLDDIMLPDIEELKKTLAPWLISKQEFCTAQCSDEEYLKENTDSESNFVNETEFAENSTQCGPIENISKGTQCQLSTSEVFTQTSDIEKRNIQIQCQIIKNNQKALKKPGKESFTQTDLRITRNACRSVSVQCNLLNQKTQKNVNKESFTQTEPKIDTHEERSIEIQCELIKRNYKNKKKSSKEFGTQTQFNRSPANIPVQCELMENNQSFEGHNNFTQCQHKNINADLEDIIKEEVESPLVLSPVDCLSINVEGAKNEESPNNSNSSPVLSNLLTVQNKILSVKICQQCDKTMYSKNEYKLHRRSHMICNFCKKRFTSVKKTKLHLENDCEAQKLLNAELIVPLIRLENLKDLQKKYPDCFEILNRLNKIGFNEVKIENKSSRIRSRSVSSIDDFYTNCSSCHYCFSVIKGITIGVDKAVQTNFLFDKHLENSLHYFCKNMFVKRKLEDNINNFVPTKKTKVTPT